MNDWRKARSIREMGAIMLGFCLATSGIVFLLGDKDAALLLALGAIAFGLVEIADTLNKRLGR